MTTQAAAALPVRSLRHVLLAGVVGLVSLELTAAAWSLLASAVWGRGLRLAAFLDPATPLPLGFRVGAPAFAAAAGALLGAALAWFLTRHAPVPWWTLWTAFALGAVLAAGVASLHQPVLLLFIASSALGFCAGARR